MIKLKTPEITFTGQISANFPMRQMKAMANEILVAGPLYTNVSIVTRMARANFDFTKATIILMPATTERRAKNARTTIVDCTGVTDFTLFVDRDLEVTED